MAAFIHKKTALLFIAPQFLITLVFFLWPALSAVKQSFFFSDPFGIHQKFAGMANFTSVIHDPQFIKAIGVTLITAIAISVLSLALGVILAYLVCHRKRSQFI